MMCAEKCCLYKEENEMRNTKRTVRIIFNKFTFVKAELIVDGDMIFMFDFTLDGGLNMRAKLSEIYMRNIMEQVKFLTDMDEFRKRFIQNKEEVLPELKEYLEREFDVNDGDTTVEYVEEV